MEVCTVSCYTNRPIENAQTTNVKCPIFWCETCNLRLSTPCSALQHITGHSHAAKLNNTGNVITSTAKDDVKKRKLEVDSKTSVLDHNTWYSANLTMKKGEEQSSNSVESGNLFCKDCNLEFNSVISSEMHFKGRKHASAVAAKGNQPKKQKLTLDEEEETNAKPINFCNDCNLEFNSVITSEQHFKGRKHASRVAAKEKQPTEQKLTPDQEKGENGKDYCYDCDVELNSELQMVQHYNGRQHKIKIGIISDPYPQDEYDFLPSYGGFGTGRLWLKNKTDWSIWGRGATHGRFSIRGSSKKGGKKVKDGGKVKDNISTTLKGKGKAWSRGRGRGKRGRKTKGVINHTGDHSGSDISTGPASIPGGRKSLSSYFVGEQSND